MGNCFTNTATQNIVQITPRPPPPANGEHGKPPSTSPKPAPPEPSGPPPPPNPMLPGSSNPACGVVGWSTMDVWSLYILERELWSGQFWTTYLCTERATGLKYVCKSASKLPGAYVVGYMRREVAILQRLCGQPNIATFRAAFEDADSLHLVMEFCSGGELFDRRIAAKGGYSERQAAALCRDVLTVVHVCHSMGVMHRDLRPENFRLASSAEGAPLKAIDFGLSVFIEEGKVYKEIVGSAYYVAPEVLRGNYGREIDVWSAGVILYILLCGSPPFWAETEKGIFDAILVGQVDLRSNPWPTISENAKDLIRQMLNRDPHKRIPAAQALEHPWLKEGGASDRPIDNAVLSRTKQFKEMNKLKQLALKETAEDPAEEVKGLKQMFDNMDIDKSGTITPEEQKIGLTKLGSKIGETEVQKLMEAVDVHKSSNIDHMEFMPAMVNKDKLEKQEDLLHASQHLDKDNNKANGEKDASRASKRSKRSGRKNDKKEAEQELNKPVNDNVVMEEVPSSQVEPDKKLEEELRKKMLAQKLAGGSGVNSSGNNEQHVQDNSTQETSVGVGNTEREVNNYKYQDKNHLEVEDVTNHKQTQENQGMNQDGVIDTNESTSGTSTGGIDRVKVNSTQGIAGKDKEYFADEARRKSGRTDTDQKMMDKPVERIKAKNLEAVLEHLWLKEGGASDRPIDSAVPLRMKQFKEMNKLKQPALKETAEDPPEEVKDAKQMFDNVDKDKTRTITPEELKISLTKLGSKIGKEEVDVDKSGSINGMEFLPSMVNKHKLEKEEEFVPASQHLDKDNNSQNIHSAHGEKDASRVDKRSKSSSRKNDKKEEEIELNKHVDDNVVMEEVPSSQAELDKKLEEDSRKKMLSRKLASGSGVNGSGNSEKHIQHNNMQEIGVGVENTKREVNNYKYQDKRHVEVEDVTDDKHAQQIQDMNQDSVVDTNESASGTSTSGRDGEEVNSTQGIVGTDKENFGDEVRKKSGRTDRERSGDDGQGSGEEAKNLEAVPGDDNTGFAKYFTENNQRT